MIYVNTDAVSTASTGIAGVAKAIGAINYMPPIDQLFQSMPGSQTASQGQNFANLVEGNVSNAATSLEFLAQDLNVAVQNYLGANYRSMING